MESTIIHKIEPKIQPADTPLQEYQTGQANDYEIICKDGQFGIHEHCLFNSEFYYKQHKARKNFDAEGI